MSDNSFIGQGNNNKIAKNALMLFFRTFFTIGLSLYISRRLLLILGESDFGIYSVVGGIAVMFNFIESAIFAGAQRFLALSINRDVNLYTKCFTTCLNVYILISLIILVLCESIGLYIINYVLNIPNDRLFAANWVYQFSVLTIVFGLTNGPYKASIIAYEKFSYFARIDILIKILQFLLVIGLAFCKWDQLILYSGAMMLLQLFRAIVDKLYCYHQFQGCRYIKFFDKSQFYALLSFSGWTFCKSGSETMVNQGNSIIINIFGGTIASASLGLGNQIWGTMANFVNNIHLAFTSQIIQSWGNSDKKIFSQLIINSMRYSSYILIIIGLPFLLNTEFILEIWLSEIPDYAVSFCQMSFISSVLYSLNNPINTGVQAGGNIKRFQIIGSLILVIDIPASYLLMRMGFPLLSVLLVRILVQIFMLVYNTLHLQYNDSFSGYTYLLGILRILLIAICSYFITFKISSLIIPNVLHAVISTIISTTLTIILLSLFSINKAEKRFIINKLRYLIIPN